MQKRKSFVIAMLLLLAMAVFFTACRGDDDAPVVEPPAEEEAAVDPPPVVEEEEEEEEYVEAEEEEEEAPPAVVVGEHPALAVLDEVLSRFPMTLENNNPILQPGDPGNTLRMVVGSPNTFPGLFEGVMASEAFDSQIMDFQRSALVSTDASFMWSDDGIATLRFDLPNNAIELNMQAEVYWHDGTPFTLDDLVFAYELMSHPEEERGVRFVDAHYVPWVLGIEEWRSGEADHISGLVLSNNNRTLRIYYDRPLPPAAQYSGSIWLTPTPRHHLEPAIAEVGVANLADHPRARHEALGWGPWIIDSIVPGESVVFRANDNYWRGRPNIDYLLWQILPLEVYMAAMREGQFDVTIQGMSAVDFEEHLLHDPNNYTILGQPATGNGFMYFRTGTFDFEDNWVTPRAPGWHPIQDVNIRRALAHAMPQQLLADTVNNGLGVPAGTIMNPFNARQFIYAGVPGFFFDLDHARNILDEAGYTEFGPDGYRLDLDGNPMYFMFAANDNAFNQRAVSTYLQMWRDIGLDVRIYQDDLIEWNTFLENVLLSDNWSDRIHLFISNWSMGANPAPHGLWGPENSFNMSRHNSEEFRAILDDIGSQEAFDMDFIMDAYRRWQIYMYENAVANQMFWNVGITAVNHRVANFSLVRESGLNGAIQRTHLWGLTAPEAYVNTN